MEDRQSHRKPHPRERSNFLKHLFFCWQVPVLLKGWRKELDEDDLYAPLKTHKAEFLGGRAEELWLLERKTKHEPSLWVILVKIFGMECVFYGLLYLPANLLFVFGKPVILRRILDYFSLGDKVVSLNEAFICAALITLVTFLNMLLLNFVTNQMYAVGIKMRVACSSLIYRHLLTLKKDKIQEVTSGNIINLMSNDATRLEEGVTFVHFIWLAPLQVVLASGYAYAILDVRAVAGIGVILLFFLIEVAIATNISKYRKRVAQKTDQRLRLVNDIVSGIQVIKMHTWEEPFGDIVANIRRLEVKDIKKSNYFRFLICSFPQLLPLSVFVVVVILVLTDTSLSSQYIYSIINIYSDLITSALLMMPIGIVSFLEFCVSVGRIQNFLLADYKKKNTLRFIESSDFKSEKGHGSVRLENVTAKIAANVVFQNAKFCASSGELVGVVGRAGSGKSTLLQVILGEIEVSGRVTVNGDLSYASQDPWIFPSSIRQNIIFGDEFNLQKYLEVIKVCALERDLSSFPHGDQTLVGEKGVMLSGGQKARINLARAVYKKADIYLLDDPLSAVDAHVAHHIYEQCIKKYLVDKCVILVTHQVHYLQSSTRIYFLEGGKIHDCGRHEHFKLGDDPKGESLDAKRTSMVGQNKKLDEIKEHRTKGINSLRIYKRYSQSAGHWCFTLAVIFLFAVSQSIASFLDFFLSYWINYETDSSTSQRYFFLIIYTIFAIALIIALYVTYFTTAAFCGSSSRNLHNALFKRIINGTMTFFNHNTSGRIMNRFSRDTGSVDEVLPMFLVYFFTQTFVIIGLLVIVSIINYWMIIASFFLCVIVFVCAIIFQPTNRNLKRTEGNTRSYVFTHLIATLQGLATIRAFNNQKILSDEFDKHQDLYASAIYLYSSTFDSFGFWTAFASVIYTGIFIFSFLLFSINFQTASVGLAITLTTKLCEVYPFMLKAWSQVETQMTSVERIVDYIDLDTEVDNGGVVPPDDWPTTGHITFESVTMKYSPDDPPVLKQITFKLISGEKVGIVGRTGAGKTSLIAALFRLFDFEGSITIDGLDTKSIPLKTLRSHISVIPQDPVLFVGTLRKNLDPFEEFSDAKIWQVLDDLELKSLFSNLPNGLDTEISEGGSNFSVGQRQLLCLVRTMLRESKIIALDEATANVDSKTDELIQTTIRKKFRDCTVLTIAHRLNTVIDSDKILVMDGGRVVEFDQPYKLLQNPQGFLYSFVKENGEKMSEGLMEVAKEAASRKSNK